MTTELDRLIEAVEAGEPVSARAATLAFPRKGYAHVVNASSGSIDAAVALLEALLPGWEWAVYGRGTAHLWKQLDRVNADDSIPARALLLAVLRTKLVEMEDE